ncbi:MAG: hypothetical protein FIB01_08700 [Gemmatimonadetes bacterium]|nr:hypothetical protein [Gemmatimonadota bacterium]
MTSVMTRGRCGVLCAVLAGLASAGAVQGQLPGARAGAGVRLENYSFSESAAVNIDQIQLLTVPVSARVPIGSLLELAVSGAFARGTVTRPVGGEHELSGMTDTEVRLTASLAADRIRLGAVALLPTGVSELDTAQADVTHMIAADLLPFAISHWGTGGGFGLNAAAALPVGPSTTVGFSAGYVLAQEYEPLAATGASVFNYRPGNQLHVRAALDQLIGRSSKLSLQLTYQQFTEDQGNQQNIYQSGDRLQALGTLAFGAGRRGAGILYAGFLRRLEGSYTDTQLPVTPVQDLLYAGGTLRQSFGGVVLVPSVDVRVVGNDAGVDQGYTLTAGTGLELPLGSIEAVPSARLRIGHITVLENQESGYSGMELGLTLRNRSLTR